MFSSIRHGHIIAVALTGLATQACAAQSDAMHWKTAETHEEASNVPTAAGDIGVHSSELAASPRLRAAEREACADVPEADRDNGPLAARDRIAGFEVLRDRPHPKEMLQPAGVAIYLRAAPGLTEQWLGRILECHIAHHAVVGDRTPDRASPLFVDDVRVGLSTTSDGFRIAITTQDVSSARQVVERAQALIE